MDGLQPAWRVGDAWTYRQQVKGGARFSYTESIVARVTFDQLEQPVECWAIERRFTHTPQMRQRMWWRVADLALLATCVDRPGARPSWEDAFPERWTVQEEPEPFLPWPRVVGQELEDTVAGHDGRIDRLRSVVGVEEVPVKAGTFRCWRVETRVARKKGVASTTYWYAPEVGRHVLVHHDDAAGEELEELIDFERGPPPEPGTSSRGDH